jgi:suppressor for copper-sensitivity B
MTFKKLFLFFLPFTFILSETFANEYNFILKKDKNDNLSLVLELVEGDIIHSNIKDSSNSFPTSIKIFPDKNLKNYHLKWPLPKTSFQAGRGKIQYFDGKVSVPLLLEAYNYAKPIKLKADIEFVVCNKQCTLIKQVIEEDIILHEQKTLIRTYIWFIGFAILGGFILNFMPCVLPVLSLKILSFMKNDNIDRKIASALTIIGIFTCFLILAGVMIILKYTGRQFGLGVNFQVPEFIIILTLIITFFISYSLGRVTFGMPNVGDALNRFGSNNHYLEHYFSGIIATILSTPCNAPFIGSALAFAFAASDYMVIVMFSSIALGFSFPYIIFILFPRILEFIPKPGAWMEKFKKVLAILLIGTIAWLLWILSSQIGDRATIGLFFLLLLFKFVVEGASGFLRHRHAKVFIALIIVTASLVLPQYAHKEDANRAAHLDNVWKKFEKDKISQLVDAGNIVFVDITADWCVTCKFNKIMSLDSNKTLELFERKNVIAMRGDFTSQDDEIYKFLTYYNRVGIPFYIIYGPAKPEGLILPLVIRHNDIVKAISSVEF